MPTGTAFVTVFMTFAGKAYIAVMETVLSVQAVVKRSISPNALPDHAVFRSRRRAVLYQGGGDSV